MIFGLSFFFSFLKTSPPCPPSDRLTHIVRLGLKAEEELEQTRKASIVVSDNVQDIGNIKKNFFFGFFQ
jgi:hypothetical protein